MKKDTIVNKEAVLLKVDGTYDWVAHEALNDVIRNISLNKIRTNPTLTLDDLKQEAWMRIYEVIDKNLQKGRELNVGYLVKVVGTTTLSQCLKESKRIDGLDNFAGMLISTSDSSTNGENSTSLKLNVAKAKLEYELSSRSSDEEKRTVLRLSLEDVLDNIEDTLVKNLIVIKYIKEFNGMSKKINKMYDDFYESCDSERRHILDTMDKFTNNAAFRALGMRATDNSSTRIRREMKNVLAVLI